MRLPWRKWMLNESEKSLTCELVQCTISFYEHDPQEIWNQNTVNNLFSVQSKAYIERSLAIPNKHNSSDTSIESSKSKTTRRLARSGTTSTRHNKVWKGSLWSLVGDSGVPLTGTKGSNFRGIGCGGREYSGGWQESILAFWFWLSLTAEDRAIWRVFSLDSTLWALVCMMSLYRSSGCKKLAYARCVSSARPDKEVLDADSWNLDVPTPSPPDSREVHVVEVVGT